MTNPRKFPDPLNDEDRWGDGPRMLTTALILGVGFILIVGGSMRIGYGMAKSKYERLAGEGCSRAACMSQIINHESEMYKRYHIVAKTRAELAADKRGEIMKEVGK